MAKFVYRMQNVLDIKYKIESQLKVNYANARNKLVEEQRSLERLMKQKRRIEDNYRKLASGPLNVFEITEGHRAIEFQRDLIKKKLVEVKVAEKNLEVARIRLNDVMKDRKTHEKLREKAFDDFLLELSAQEKKEIDELVSYRYSLDDKKDK